MRRALRAVRASLGTTPKSYCARRLSGRAASLSAQCLRTTGMGAAVCLQQAGRRGRHDAHAGAHPTDAAADILHVWHGGWNGSRMAIASVPHACLLGPQALHSHAGMVTPCHNAGCVRVPAVTQHVPSVTQHVPSVTQHAPSVMQHVPVMTQRARTSCSPLLCAPAGWRGCWGCASGTPGAGMVALGVLICSRPPAVSGAGPEGDPPQASGSGMAMGAKRVATGSKYAVPGSAVSGGMRSGATCPTCTDFRSVCGMACMSLGSSSSRCVLSAFVPACVHRACAYRKGVHSLLDCTHNSSQHGIPSAKRQMRWLMAAPCECCRGRWLMLRASHGLWLCLAVLP